MKTVMKKIMFCLQFFLFFLPDSCSGPRKQVLPKKLILQIISYKGSSPVVALKIHNDQSKMLIFEPIFLIVAKPDLISNFLYYPFAVNI
jgi:hypothetical protein